MTPPVTSCVLIRRIIQAYLTIPIGNSKGFEEKTENPMERGLMIIKFLRSWGNFENSKGKGDQNMEAVYGMVEIFS